MESKVGKEKNQIQVGITKPATAWYNKFCLLDSVRISSKAIHQPMYLRTIWLVGRRKENLCVRILSFIVQNVHWYQVDLSFSHLSISWAGGERQVVLTLNVPAGCAYIDAGDCGSTWEKPTNLVTVTRTNQVTKIIKDEGAKSI